MKITFFQKLNRQQWLLVGNIVAAGCLLLIMAAVMWHQPLLADDWDFYRAITDWKQLRQLIPHPQTYVHFTQLCLAIFGEKTSNARIPGVLSALCNLILIPMLVYALWGKDQHTDSIAILAIWLYTLNPLTAQNMMLLDIDNTLLTPVLGICIWLWKRRQNHTFAKQALVLGLAFAVALWVKLPTPVLLMVVFGFYHGLRKEFKQTLAVLCATVLGVSLFLLTFSLYNALTGFSFAILNRTLQKAPLSTSSIPGMLMRFPQGLGVLVLWLSFPLTILLAIVTVKMLLRLRKQQLEEQDLLVIFIVGTTLFYALVIPPAWGYPKYQTPLIPLIVILVAKLLIPNLAKVPRRAVIVAIIVAVCVFVYKLVGVGDPFYTLYAVTFETDIGDLGVRLVYGLQAMFKLLVPIIFTLFIGYLFSKRWKLNPFLVILVVLGTLALADMASTTAVQVKADYSTRYRYTYDYDDLAQTLADLRQAKVHYILAVMDVLYYDDWSGEQIYYKYVCSTCNPQTLIDEIYTKRVDALVWTTKEDNRSPNVSRDPELCQVLDQCYTNKQHGVFIVYLRKPDAPCPQE